MISRSISTRNSQNRSAAGVSPEILLPSEKDRLLFEAKKGNFRDYMLIRLALGTGMRNSECVGLTIFCIAPYGDVSKFLEIPKTIAKKSSGRSIPLHPDLINELNSFLKWKMENGESIAVDSPLFVSCRTKNFLSPRDFQRILKFISTKSIGRSVHPHILRHTFATELLSKSNIRIVQKALGHTSIQSTQIYTHPSSSEMSDAIAKM